MLNASTQAAPLDEAKPLHRRIVKADRLSHFGRFGSPPLTAAATRKQGSLRLRYGSGEELTPENKLAAARCPT